MSRERDNTTLTILAYIDACIQSVMILLDAILFFIAIFSKNNEGPSMVALFGMLCIGVYQLISAFIRTIIEIIRKTRYQRLLLFYWIGFVIAFACMYLERNFNRGNEASFYALLILCGLLAIYYCFICWKLTLQTNKNEH